MRKGIVPAMTENPIPGADLIPEIKKIPLRDRVSVIGSVPSTSNLGRVKDADGEAPESQGTGAKQP